MPDKRTTQRARQNPAPATDLPAGVPQTSTHYRQAGIDLGYPELPGILEIDLWTPHNQDGVAVWPYWNLGEPLE